MAKKEANFDLYIHDLLVEAGIQADTQGSNIIEINNALKSASKHKMSDFLNIAQLSMILFLSWRIKLTDQTCVPLRMMALLFP